MGHLRKRASPPILVGRLCSGGNDGHQDTVGNPGRACAQKIGNDRGSPTSRTPAQADRRSASGFFSSDRTQGTVQLSLSSLAGHAPKWRRSRLLAYLTCPGTLSLESEGRQCEGRTQNRERERASADASSKTPRFTFTGRTSIVTSFGSANAAPSGPNTRLTSTQQTLLALMKSSRFTHGWPSSTVPSPSSCSSVSPSGRRPR